MDVGKEQWRSLQDIVVVVFAAMRVPFAERSRVELDAEGFGSDARVVQTELAAGGEALAWREHFACAGRTAKHQQIATVGQRLFAEHATKMR